MRALTLLCLLAACGPVSGREVSGDIKVDTTWYKRDCPLVVKGDVNVHGSGGHLATLTIEEGCLIRFAPNTVLAVSQGTTDPGALRAIGSANDPIVFTSANDISVPGSWGGLRFYDANDDTHTRLEHVQVNGAGAGDNGAAIEVSATLLDAVSLTVNGAPKAGILFTSDAGFSATTTAITVQNAGTYGLSIGAGRAGTVPKIASSYAGMLGAAEIQGGDITTEQTWHDIGMPWIVSDNINVAGGSTPVLTLESGVRLNFARDKEFTVAANGSGGLRTQGSSGNEVVLSGVIKERGSWKGLTINAPSGRSTTLSYTNIEYGGGNKNEAGLAVITAQVTMQNVTVTESSKDGILLTGTSATNVPELVTGSTAIVAKSNTRYGFRAPANVLGSIPADGCNFNGNGSYGVYVENGAVKKSQIWQSSNVPYVFATDLVIGLSSGSDTVLTLQPGTILAFQDHHGISVGADKGIRGSLRALGQPSDKIIFTSVKDGANPGDWSGVRFFGTPTSVTPTLANASRLAYTVIRFAAPTGQAAVTVDVAPIKPSIEGLEVASAAGFGACLTTGNTATELNPSDITFTNVDGGDFCP